MINKDFYNLLKEDEFGLLQQSEQNKPITENDRLIESFLEIIKFYEDNNKLPELNDIHERKLAVRLKAFKESSENYKFLNEYDKFGLLNTDSKENKINIDDEFGLLDLSDDDYSVSKMVNVPKADRSQTDFVAHRKVCKDFDNYKGLFGECSDNIKDGSYTLKKFEHGDIAVNNFYISQGILLFVKSINFNDDLDKFGKEDGRTHCIFDNGTESFMKFRSLQKSLEKDGKTVIKMKYIENEDLVTGYIYILKSLNNDQKIQNVKDLYKIGFSTTEVEDRIKNAEIDPTYLMAPVKLVYKIKCFNLDPHRFERLIHRFFGEVCLDVQIADNSGKLYTPKEWFSVPLEIIEEAVDLIISGDIINYEYDKYLRSIKKKILNI